MKCSLPLLKHTGMVMLCALLMLNCRKNDPLPDPNNPPPVVPGLALHADSISNHLQFLSATKKQGKIPQGPAGSSLKISVKDTLYLMDEVKRPIKFLHLDTTKNVSGVYIQIQSVAIGATFYYDVPEIPEMADNDTVSVILIGIDPKGLTPSAGVPPAGSPFPPFIITITPYDKNGQPIATADRPAKIVKPGSGPCGLVLPPGDYWDWHLTLIENPTSTGLVFYNDYDKVWGIGGQNIKGCCINGISSYGTTCASRPEDQRSLRFPTFFRYFEESIKFFDDGTFARFTKELHALPDPDLSNFCGTGPGLVHRVQYNVSYFGNYTVSRLTAPYKGDSLSLQMLTTSKAGGTGFGRSGGIIHQLDCSVLVLIQPDREGFDRDAVSFFTRITDGQAPWYQFP